jgi:hypothetical protein
MNDAVQPYADPILEGFLSSCPADADYICQNSDCIRISPDASSGVPPRTYQGILKGAQHYVRDPQGAIVVSDRPIHFSIGLADDYLKSLDDNLQFRVVSTSRHLVHPNVCGGVVCLGGRFRPATRLRSVVEQFYAIATSRVAATGHPFDLPAAEFYLDHMDVIRGFQSEPLWRRPLSTRTRVEEISPTPSHSESA